MSTKLPSESRIRDRLRAKLHPLIVEQPALAADVVPGVLAEAVAIVSEFQREIERLEAAADPEALHAFYAKGRSDEREVWRKRMPDEAEVMSLRLIVKRADSQGFQNFLFDDLRGLLNRLEEAKS